MAFVDVEDLTGNQKVIIFPRVYKICKPLLKEGNVVCLKCIRDVAEIDVNSDDLQINKVIVLDVERLDNE